jgi:hypothetical protein
MKPILLASLAVLLAAATAKADTITIPDDYPTVQAGVDAAVTGDTIIVRPGVYRENVTVITSGISILGSANKSVIDGAYLGLSLTVTADDVRLQGLTFNNGGVEITGQEIEVTKCRVRASAATGLQLTGSGTIQTTTISYCLGTGLVVASGDSVGPLTKISKNTVNHNGAGIELSNGPFDVSRNVVANNSGDGLSLSFLTGTASNTVVSGTEIARNDLLGNEGAGLLLVDDLGSVTVIEKNDVIGNGKGMDISTSAGALRVAQNEVDQNLAGGIFLKTAGATLEDNKLRRNSLVGIVILSTGGATDGGNMLEDNMLEANGGDGLHIESGSNVLHHNYMKDNNGDGLQVAAGADANELTANITRNNVHDGLDNWGTNTIISDTKSWDNGGADIAGIGDGTGTVDPSSVSNSADDLTDLTSQQELELVTLLP